MKLAYRAAPAPKLILVPFLDMFTTLLAFLLISFSPHAAKARHSRDIVLPTSSQQISNMPSLKVEIGKEQIKINNQVVDGMNPSTTDATIWDRFQTQMKQSPEQEVLVVADRDLDFGVVDQVVHHISLAGHGSIFLLTDFKQMEKQP